MTAMAMAIMIQFPRLLNLCAALILMRRYIG